MLVIGVDRVGNGYLIAPRIPPGRAGIDDEAATWRLEGPGGGSWGPGRGPGGSWGVPGGPGGVPGGVPGGSRGGPGGSRGGPGGSFGACWWGPGRILVGRGPQEASPSIGVARNVQKTL